MANKREVDMLHGPLLWKIFFFAMPLAASSILQQLFNSADVAVVGRFAGADALAAVGANTSVTALFVNTFVGLAVGSNVVMAQCIGRRRYDQVKAVVHTSILFAMIIGMVLLIVGLFVAAPILQMMGTPDNVLPQAVIYLRVYFIGVPFAVVYNFGAAILRSIGDTKRPMVCLASSGLLNVCLNLFFVIVCRMGVAGVALATALANVFSASMVILMLVRENSYIKLEFRSLRLSKSAVISIMKFGGPAAIQSMVFSLSNVCLQSGINTFGTAAIAGSATAVTFEYFDYFMVSAFNQAAVTFIGQNYAAGKYDRCKRIFAICMVESVICVTLMVLTFMLGQNFWLSLYTTDPAVIEFAKLRMTIALIPHMLICSYEITGFVLRGMGRSLLPAVLTVLGSVVFRLIWLFTVFRHWHSMTALLRVYPCSWILTGSMVIGAYLIVGRRMLKD